MIINHNIAAMTTLNALNKNEAATTASLEKLSTGLKINSAADDAAGLSISEKMRSQINGLNQAVSNAQGGISLTQTAEGALSETTSILQTQRGLAVEAANDTTTDSDRTAAQDEISQLSDEIDTIANTTQFNSKNLLDGSMAAGSSVAQGTKLNSVALQTAATQGTSVGNTLTTSAATPTVITTGTNDQLNVNVDGEGAQSITLAAGSYTSTTDLATAVNTAIGKNSSLAGKVTAEVTSTGALAFVSASTGTSSSVAVTAGTIDDASTALGMSTPAEATGVAAKTSASMSGTVTGGTVLAGAALTVAASPANALDISVDGGASVGIAVAASTYSSASALVSAVNTAINATTLKGSVTAKLSTDNKLEFVSASTGTNSAVNVTGGGGETALMGGTNGSTVGNADVSTVTLGSAPLVLTAANNKMNLAVDGGTGVDISVATGSYSTSTALVAAVNAGITASSLSGKVSASFDSTTNSLMFTSATTGTASSVVATATTGNTGLTAMVGTVTATAGTGIQVTTGTAATDQLTSLADASGNNYGLKSGNQINVSVLVGGQQKTTSLAVTSTTTMQDLADSIQTAIGGSSSVSIGTDATGKSTINITGQAGTANEVSNLTLSAQNSATDTTATATNFGADLSANTETQVATNIQTDGSLTFQIGANQGQTMNVNINKMDTQALGLSSINVSTQAGAESAITVIDNAVSKVSTERAKLGAYENRLSDTIDNLNTSSENMTSAESNIRDVDMASEMTNYQKNSVLEQAAQSMLAQANQLPQQALKLLQ